MCVDVLDVDQQVCQPHIRSAGQHHRSNADGELDVVDAAVRLRKRSQMLRKAKRSAEPCKCFADVRISQPGND